MMHFISTLLIEFIVFLSVIQYILSIMSGDSPNAFIDDNNAFNFTTPQKDDNNGRSSSPTPTTSKDTTVAIQQASVSVEPLAQNDKTTPIKEGGGDDVADDDQPDFSSPLHNNRDVEKYCNETDKTLPLTDMKYDDKNGGGGGGGDKNLHNKNLINGEVKKDQYDLEKNEDNYDECIVSCLYYTGECCRCSII